MKCAYYQKQKQNRMKTEARELLGKVVNNFMQKSMIVGTDKALEMMQEEMKNKEENSNEIYDQT